MKNPATNLTLAFGLIVIGFALGAAGIYVGETDDAPGAALIGIVLMLVAFALAAKTVRRGMTEKNAR